VKLAAYIRVSSDTQVEEGNGLEVQRRAITRWAKTNGHRVVRWCSDEGISGAVDALDRAGLSCVIAAVESRDAEGIVVARLDRLARKLTVQEAALAHVWRAGGSVFTVDTGEVAQDDADDPMRTAMRMMVGVFAELERLMIAKRMRGGRRMKAEKGLYAQGAPRYGFRAENRSLVPENDEQQTLERIRELHEQGRSLRAIASTLTEEGRKPKRAARWHPESLRLIVNRLTPTA
jgi:DNA invertase Pin-like site-specific DNA recombinase